MAKKKDNIVSLPTDEIAGCPTLKQNDKGDIVKTMQSLLAKGGSKITVNGVYGIGTRNAIKAFQKKAGLEQDGVCGPETWSMLIRSYAIPEIEYEPLYTVTLYHIQKEDKDELLSKYEGKAIEEN